MLVLRSIQELISDTYSKANSLHIHNFGTFTFELIEPAT